MNPRPDTVTHTFSFALDQRRRRRMEMATRVRKPIGTTATTGQRCPESGVWQAQYPPYGTAPIAEGNVMPPYQDRAVVWKLIQYA